MKIILTIVLMVFSASTYAQNAEKEINEQVWKPFTKAIMAQDVEAFVAVHSKDVIRVEQNDNKIMELPEYKETMKANWPGWKESIKKNGSQYIFELRFTERMSNDKFAYEVGYFKNESINKAGVKRVYYGQFHVTLRKENGIWKILMDSDSNLGNTITDAMFNTAKPLE